MRRRRLRHGVTATQWRNLWLHMLIRRFGLLMLLLVPGIASPQTAQCGFPPFPPPGCVYICLCDQNAPVCHWVLMCNGGDDDDPDSD